MSLNTFIPSVWSASILRGLQKSHVYASDLVCNRDYEGEITGAGDSVRINSISDPTVGSYTKNTDISAAEDLDSVQQVLLIDQQKYVNFQVDDIDKAQTKPKVMDEAMSRAGYKLADTIDQFMAGLYTEAGLTSGLGTDASALVPSANTAGTTVYEYLVDMGVLLDTQDCPGDERFAILPPWMCGLLQKDNRFVGYGTAESRATIARGLIGNVAGFNILKSNNVPNTSDAKYKVLAGHKIAWSFAEQLVSMEAYRPQLRFGDAIKALHVYGGKVVRPNCLALGTFSKP